MRLAATGAGGQVRPTYSPQVTAKGDLPAGRCAAPGAPPPPLSPPPPAMIEAAAASSDDGVVQAEAFDGRGLRT
eukprot:CAMPEP_0172195542 /NCGR_PEP_ID=MMETSP1050-20130122/26273_1 /TAXON_ID=233186 /ORGANISM="Cryptomonas curvata, Strain CCAP979/52" /LENGTH=73 /DNA_ID=CAMNT_0012871631 /DNA_START=314 /DNA_END=535 /DNA_ORIENTATION=+